jgi:hypothetical protein
MRMTELAPVGLLAGIVAAWCDVSALAAPAPQSPVMIGSRRIGSATARRYGVGREVLATVALVKGIGEARRLGSRAVQLPVEEYEPIAEFDYVLPQACGGYVFRVYETGRTQILEFAYSDADGATFLIRDYVVGANPFIKPGLWSAFDHTADTIPYMRAELVETQPPAPRAVYLKALVTGDSESLQRELGMAYKRAVRAAVRCETAAPLVASLTR